MWHVYILLRSGKDISIDNLQSVNRKSAVDSSIKKITDFNEFHLTKDQGFSFVGESTTITLNSNDIEFVQFDRVEN